MEQPTEHLPERAPTATEMADENYDAVTSPIIDAIKAFQASWEAERRAVKEKHERSLRGELIVFLVLLFVFAPVVWYGVMRLVGIGSLAAF